jgi:hypothetical protein
MIDISSERLLTFTEAAKLLPGNVHLSTLHRWRLSGTRGVKLESCLVGGKRLTSAEALQRFAERTTAAANGEPEPVASVGRTSAQRLRDIERAERELDDNRA